MISQHFHPPRSDSYPGRAFGTGMHLRFGASPNLLIHASGAWTFGRDPEDEPPAWDEEPSVVLAVAV